MARDLVVRIVGDSKSLERSLERSERATRRFGQQTDRTFRGVIAGSGAFRSLGRSVAFASSAFLGGVGLSAAIRSSTEAAQDQIKTQKALDAQFRASGVSLSRYQSRIDEVAASFVKLGIQDDETIKAFTTLFRASGNVTDSLDNLQLVADIAAARHIDLQKAALLVAKVTTGNVGILRRYGVEVDKNATVQEALTAATEKFAGQARAAVTPQARFEAILDRTQEIIGGALLPAFTKILNQVGSWLQRMNETGQLQRRVNALMEQATRVFGALRDIFVTLVSVGRTLTGVFGGIENTVKLMAAAFVGVKAARFAASLGLVTTSATNAAAAFKTLRGNVLLAAAAYVVFNRTNIQKKLEDDQGALGKFAKFAQQAFGGPTRTFEEVFGFESINEKLGRMSATVTGIGTAFQKMAKLAVNAMEAVGAAVAQAAAKTGKFTGQATGGGRLNLAPFALPFGLQLKQAQAAATKARRDDVSVAKQVKAFAEAIIASVQPLVESGQVQGKALKTLRQKLLAAYSALADANSTLADAATKSAKKALEAAAEQRKTLAANIKSAVLQRLQARQTDILNRRALADAQEQLRLAKKLGGPQGIRAAQRGVQDVRFAMLTARLERAPATLNAGGRFAFGGVVININGVTDPDAVARKVEAILRRRQRHTSTPMRGPAAGTA